MTTRWFIHANGQQEGPLTVEEVRRRIASGQISVDDYAWNEGREDWDKIEKIAELQRAPKMPSAIVPTPSSVTHVGSASETRAVGKKRRGGYGRLIAFMVVLSVIAISVAYVQGYFDRWISGPPMFAELTQEENSELFSVAKADLKTHGPQLAFALSQRSSASPVVYVTTNLPDGTNLDLQVLGVTQTLVGDREFEDVYPLVVSHHYAKSPPIRRRNGSAIPSGQYQIMVSDSEDQPELPRRVISRLKPISADSPLEGPQGRRIFLKKRYTLLGGMREDAYAASLRGYHTQVRGKASAEARELNEWIPVLVQSFESTQEAFARLRELPRGQDRTKQWAAFHSEWSSVVGAYSSSIEAHRPGTLQGHVFYGKRYRLAYEAWSAVFRLLDLQTAFLTTAVDTSAFLQEIAESSALAEKRLSDLRARMEKTTRSFTPTDYPPQDD